MILECVVSSLERLASNLSLLNPFPAWAVASKYPSLVLCKFQIHGSGNVNRTLNYCVITASGLTFEVFLAMELEIRSHLQGCKPVNFITDIAPAVKSNEDVLFFWSMLSCSWDEESSKTLFQMVVDLWLTVCGYSHSSAWVEKYKVAQKKSTWKSKGIRKQL